MWKSLIRESMCDAFAATEPQSSNLKDADRKTLEHNSTVDDSAHLLAGMSMSGFVVILLAVTTRIRDTGLLDVRFRSTTY
jgi:hypothetical protein